MADDVQTHKGHVAFECHCNRTGCMFCDGGLFSCTICGALEGALLPQCPGRWLSQAEHDENYAHYCAGTGPFAERGPFGRGEGR